MDYQHQSLWSNGRIVYLKDIELNKVSPVSESEKTTFDFVRLWLKGQSTFDIKTSGSTGIPR